jgi:hypothetical protein
VSEPGKLTPEDQSERNDVAVLDDIAAEKQRVTDRLARVDAERERLAQQLAGSKPLNACCRT